MLFTNSKQAVCDIQLPGSIIYIAINRIESKALARALIRPESVDSLKTITSLRNTLPNTHCLIYYYYSFKGSIRNFIFNVFII